MYYLAPHCCNLSYERDHIFSLSEFETRYIEVYCFTEISKGTQQTVTVCHVLSTNHSLNYCLITIFNNVFFWLQAIN